MPSCVERLLLTAAALTLYVNFRRGLIRVHRSKDVRHNVRSFPPFMAGKQKQTSTAGRVATAAAAFTLPKMPFSSQQHSLMSSCRLPSDDAAAKVKLKLKGRRRRRCCHRNNLIINNIIIAVIIMVAAQTLSSTHHTHIPLHTLAHTPPHTMCFFLFSFTFFFLF